MQPTNEHWKSREVAKLLTLVETERRYYQEMVAHLPVSVAVMNQQGVLVAANRAFRQAYQVKLDDFGKRIIDQVFPSKELRARMESVFESGVGSRPLVVERKLPTAGAPQRLRISVQLIRDWNEDSGIQAMVVVEDLTESGLLAERVVDTLPVAAEPLPIEHSGETEPEIAVVAPAAAPEPIAGQLTLAGAAAPAHVEEPPPAVAVAPTAAVALAPAPAYPGPLPCVIWMAERATRRFTYVSPSARVLLDIDPVEWLHTQNFFANRIDAADRKAVQSFYDGVLSNPGLHSCEFRMRRSGVWYRETILVEAGSDTFTGVITDVTARRVLEEQTLQSQRFEALSQLAGRVAHDVNNPLMIVNGYAEDLATAFAPNDPRSSDMREIQAAGKRMSELTAQLQAVTRRHAFQLVAVEVNAQLATVVARMRAAAGEYLKADYVASAGPLSVQADASQLDAVLLELAAALVEGGGEAAHLVLSAKPYRAPEYIRADQPLLAGDFVQISIINNSQGAPPVQARLFESLLPGREPGGEAGPALARAFKTIQDWGGTITTVPANNEICVYLKAVPAPEPPPPPPAPAAAPEPDRDMSNEPQSRVTAFGTAPVSAKTVEFVRKTNILIVEDEPGIRALMRKILHREGFEVFEAATGPEALEILGEKGPFSLLITDVVMPGMSGLDLASHVKAKDPHCGILYMSGFTAETGVETGQFPPGSHFLQKPFTLGSLLRKANEVLASTPRRQADTPR